MGHRPILRRSISTGTHGWSGNCAARAGPVFPARPVWKWRFQEKLAGGLTRPDIFHRMNGWKYFTSASTNPAGREARSS